MQLQVFPAIVKGRTKTEKNGVDQADETSAKEQARSNEGNQK